MSEPAPHLSAADQLIESAVDDVGDELIALRRDLHAHPELSWRELRTTTLVAARLRKSGWRVTEVDSDAEPEFLTRAAESVLPKLHAALALDPPAAPQL